MGKYEFDHPGEQPITSDDPAEPALLAIGRDAPRVTNVGLLELFANGIRALCRKSALTALERWKSDAVIIRRSGVTYSANSRVRIKITDQRGNG